MPLPSADNSMIRPSTPDYGYTRTDVPPPTNRLPGLFGRNAGSAERCHERQSTTPSTGERPGENDGRRSGDDPWDYFAFLDRDFTSVIELTMVPGCPPGLFTKLFLENARGQPGRTTRRRPGGS